MSQARHDLSPSPLNAPLQRLDSCSLGRPVHLLPQVADALREALNQALRQHWNRRYHARYEVVDATFTPFNSATPGALLAHGRWLQARDAGVPAACFVERGLVLHMMAQRLGLDASATSLSSQEAPETATEDRLLHSLARSLTERCLRVLQDPAAAGDAAIGSIGSWLPVSAPRLPAGAWLLSLQIQAPGLAQAQVWLAIAGDAMDGALRALAAASRNPRKDRHAPPLGRRLQLTLKAQLLERQALLAEVLELRPGSLIPVHLGQATVHVEGAALFRAQVAEHQGKLCLTSFQDME